MAVLRTAALRWEIHAAQEVLEARVGAQGIEPRIELEERHIRGAFPIAFLQPF